jgi:hypothetical protein
MIKFLSSSFRTLSLAPDLMGTMSMRSPLAGIAPAAVELGKEALPTFEP